MSNDIYDYFSGNAPKKIEPIDDDDLDLEEIDEPSTATNDPGSASSEGGAESEQTAETASTEPSKLLNAPEASEPVSPSSDPEPSSSETACVETESDAPVDPWDALLGDLGITPPPKPKKRPTEKSQPTAQDVSPGVAKSASAPTPSPRVSPPAASPSASDDSSKQVAQEESAPTPSSPTSKTDFFGLEPIPNPEDETILAEMFSPPGEAAPEQEIFQDKGSPLAETKGEAEDSELEYLEFEVEDLDDSPYAEGEEISHGRRRRRRPRHQEADVRSPSSEPDGSSSVSEVDVTPHVSPPKSSEEEKPTRSRRGSRGRGRRRRKGGDRPNDSKSEVAPIEADEIGWSTPAPSKQSVAPEEARASRPHREQTQGSTSEDLDQELPPPRRKRRPQQQTTSSPAPPTSGFGAGILEETDFLDEGVEGRSDEQQTPDAPSPKDHQDDSERRPRRRRRGKKRRDDRPRDPACEGSEAPQALEKKSEAEPAPPQRKSKFPTWKEAIDSLIESNIKNHSKSGGGRNRGRGRSRNRGR